jgi:cytochrome c-type biogenesis protein CcmH
MSKAFFFNNFLMAPPRRARRRGESGFSYLPLVAMVAIVTVAAGLYLAIGRPDLAGESNQAQAAQTAPQATASQDVSLATVESLLSRLEQRLQREPEDGKGWLLLAKSYDHLGRTAEAIEAYAQARALGSSDLLLESRLVNSALETGSAHQPGNEASNMAAAEQAVE